MASGVSKVSIANGAIQRLGSPGRIEALDQNSPNARSISAAYNTARNALLRTYDWSFAIKREAIPAHATGPVWGSWNRYALPGDFIRLVRDDESGIRVDYRIEGQFILSRMSAPLPVRYIANIDDASYFDSLFTEALILKIAVDTCEEITGSTAKRDSLFRDLKDTIAQARLSGAIEKGEVTFPEDEWVSARL